MFETKEQQGQFERAAFIIAGCIAFAQVAAVVVCWTWSPVVAVVMAGLFGWADVRFFKPRR